MVAGAAVSCHGAGAPGAKPGVQDMGPQRRPLGLASSVPCPWLGPTAAIVLLGMSMGYWILLKMWEIWEKLDSGSKGV